MTIIDMFSGLDHKAGMGDNAPGDIDNLPAYLDDEQARRLQAYLILRGAMETVGRYFVLEDPADPDKKADLREYNDAGTLVDRVVAGVLGKEPALEIAGADDDVPPSPPIPDPPIAPGDDAPDDLRAVLDAAYQAALAVWTENSAEAIERWTDKVGNQGALKTRQDWLQEWADRDLFLAKLRELEQAAVVPLGSGLMVFGWDPEKGRVSAEIYEPEVYMPVLDDQSTEFPKKVHLVWIFPVVEGDDTVDYVRRITYELVRVDGLDESGVTDFGTRPAYLGNEADDPWVYSCVYSNGVMKLDDFENGTDGQYSLQFEEVPDPASPGTTVPADRIPIGLDFIPIVHFTNDLASLTHFGRPLLIRAMQIMDEVAATDTDAALLSRLVARPPQVFTDLPPGSDKNPDGTDRELTVGPNQSLILGKDGRMFTMDLAEHLATVMENRAELRDLLGTNTKIPAGLVGRLDPTKVASGAALSISFTPFEQLIEDMREARSHRWALCGKMVQRIAIQNQDPTIDGPDVYPARMRTGSFMPQDLQGIASAVSNLRGAQVISQTTGMRMAVAAGAPVEDIGQELAAVRLEMGDEALAIADATGSTELAARFLGHDVLPDSGDAAPGTGTDAGPAVGLGDDA